MKKLKTLKASWYFGSMAVAVVLGLLAAKAVEKTWGLRIPPIPLGALCVGLVAVTVSFIYDGTD
jgi:hypothetical protein